MCSLVWLNTLVCVCVSTDVSLVTQSHTHFPLMPQTYSSYLHVYMDLYPFKYTIPMFKKCLQIFGGHVMEVKMLIDISELFQCGKKSIV